MFHSIKSRCVCKSRYFQSSFDDRKHVCVRSEGHLPHHLTSSDASCSLHLFPLWMPRERGVQPGVDLKAQCRQSNRDFLLIQAHTFSHITHLSPSGGKKSANRVQNQLLLKEHPCAKLQGRAATCRGDNGIIVHISHEELRSAR